VILGRVKGTVVSTVQLPFLDGKRLLLVERVTPEGQPAGGSLIAVDAVQAGLGQTVLVIDEGNSARQVLDAKDAPVRSVIVGIVDSVTRG
jgi:microcompartment protein CcmK/EutM